MEPHIYLDELSSVLNSVLRLPRNREVMLRMQEKLTEYTRRKNHYMGKHSVDGYGVLIGENSSLLDSIYKEEILKILIKKGSANIKTIYDDMFKRFKGYVDDDLYANAVRVIEDYLRTGGSNTSGGSGFLTDDLFENLLKDQDVIMLPKDDVLNAKLKKKYHEYLGRIVERQHQSDTSLDMAALKRDGYKARILEILRKDGTVTCTDLAKKVHAEEGNAFSKLEFCRAAAVIRSYCKQGGKVKGGTGF